MFVNYLKNSLLLVVILFFVSCEKDMNCLEPLDECQLKCQMVPDMGWCGTGAEYKYFFNPSTGQCEAYIHLGADVPFETLEACQSCRCSVADN